MLSQEEINELKDALKKIKANTLNYSTQLENNYGSFFEKNIIWLTLMSHINNLFDTANKTHNLLNNKLTDDFIIKQHTMVLSQAFHIMQMDLNYYQSELEKFKFPTQKYIEYFSDTNKNIHGVLLITDHIQPPEENIPSQSIIINISDSKLELEKYDELSSEIGSILLSIIIITNRLDDAVKVVPIIEGPLTERCGKLCDFLTTQIDKLKDKNEKFEYSQARRIPTFSKQRPLISIVETYNKDLLKGIIKLLSTYRTKLELLSQTDGLKKVDLYEKKELLLNRVKAFEQTEIGEKINKNDNTFFSILRSSLSNAKEIPTNLSHLPGYQNPEIKEELEKMQKTIPFQKECNPDEKYHFMKHAVLNRYLNNLCRSIDIDTVNFKIKRDFINEISSKIKETTSFISLKHALLEIKTQLLLMNFCDKVNVLGEEKRLILEAVHQEKCLIWVNSILYLMKQDPEKLIAAGQVVKVSSRSFLNTNNPSDSVFNPVYSGRNEDL